MTDARSAMNYSYVNKPKAINIDVATLSGGPIEKYYIEFWYYPDTRKQYYPRKTVPAGKKIYIFWSTSVRIIQKFNTGQTALLYFLERDDGTEIIPTGTQASAYLTGSGWHKFTIKVEAAKISLIMDNKFFNTTDDVFMSKSLAGPFPLSFICFCENDPVCAGGVDVYWGSAYYRNLRVWNTVKFPFINDRILTQYNIYDS